MGTSGQRRRGIPHARDGDEFEPRGWTDRRTKIGSGTVGGPSEVRPLSSSNAVREREREKSGISSRTPDLFEPFYLSFFHFSTSSSSPVFLQLPLFSFLLHRVSRSPFPSLSLSPFLLHLHRSRYPYLPLCSTFSSSFFSSIREGLHGTRNFSSPRCRHTQPPSKTTYTRATHERERDPCLHSFSPSTDGGETTDRISARTSPFYLLVDLYAESSSTEDPRSRGATRACASPLPPSPPLPPSVADVSRGE